MTSSSFTPKPTKPGTLPNSPRWTFHPIYRSTIDSYTNLALTNDGATAFLSHRFFLKAYKVATFQWFPSRANTEEFPALFNVGSITDTDSGLIYELASSGDDIPYWVLSIFDPASGRCTTQGMASFAIKGRGQLKGVFSRSQTLTNTTVTGTIPDARKGACLASNAEGTKIILAGGLKGAANDSTTTTPPVTNTTTPGQALQDIYLFDVESLTWSRLKDSPTPYYHAACAFQGNHLILLGGYKSFNSYNLSNYEYNTNDVAILDVKDNVWINSYTAPAMSAANAKMRLGLFGSLAITVLTLWLSAFGDLVL
ncbi:hypothetical protein BG005_003305 [Podila minutissima]|nr:hypothetical protein BG005_003305 [Podila minutissima]